MTVEELKTAARRMRAYNILAIHCAGSGHPGGTLSVMDIAAALYLKIIKHDQQYMGSITYTDSEKKDLFRVMCIHQDCWKQLLHTHKGR